MWEYKKHISTCTCSTCSTALHSSKGEGWGEHIVSIQWQDTVFYHGLMD